DWVRDELLRRFDVACCATAEQFAREPRAITRAGQIKDPGGRHEKDDRHRIDDRARYVLGWTNAAKIAALEARREQAGARLEALGERTGDLVRERDALKGRVEALARLEEFTAFEELDFASVAAAIATLVAERERLAAASD